MPTPEDIAYRIATAMYPAPSDTAHRDILREMLTNELEGIDRFAAQRGAEADQARLRLFETDRRREGRTIEGAPPQTGGGDAPDMSIEAVRARLAAYREGAEEARQDALRAPFTKALVAEARTQGCQECAEAMREACALILKGRVYKERYREYPALGGDGNWSGDSAFVRHCDKFAEAIRALPIPGK